MRRPRYIYCVLAITENATMVAVTAHLMENVMM